MALWQGSRFVFVFLLDGCPLSLSQIVMNHCSFFSVFFCPSGNLDRAIDVFPIVARFSFLRASVFGSLNFERKKNVATIE